MKTNVGGLDRVMRIALGANLALLAIWGPLDPWGWLGLIPLLSGLMGFCPAYECLRLSTLHKGN
ncbi:MAG: hypothetical protein JWN23_3191 [Rhodocyclales bacterium]|nr:hypothetical protein [Rhodocyclales bacterium]